MECSNPSATNVLMGQKMARILPATEVDAIVPQTARHTSQLHRTPLKNATPNGREAFVVAIPMTAAFAAGAAAVAAPKARYAITTLPMKFPAYDRTQFLISASVLTRLANTPLSMVMTFPVKSSAPVRITRVRPAGKPTAPFRKLHKPGLAAASAGDAAPMQLISKAPMPMSAPAENPRTSVVVGSCAAFFSAVAHTVLNTAGEGARRQWGRRSPPPSDLCARWMRRRSTQAWPTRRRRRTCEPRRRGGRRCARARRAPRGRQRRRRGWPWCWLIPGANWSAYRARGNARFVDAIDGVRRARPRTRTF